MTTEYCIGPGPQDLRPVHPTRSDFPVYRDLAAELAKPDLPLDPGGVVPHVLAVASAYSYAEDRCTLATIMTRMGLDGPRCARVTQLVDAMLIDASASVIQSEDGKVVVVAFRGTPPLSVLTWLIDTDFRPQKVVLSALQDSEQAQAYQVHAGIYRNLRAIRFTLLELLLKALRGESVVPGAPGTTSPMEALYVTGHSLGGSMAALFSLFLRADPAYADLTATLAGTATFGQPMVGTRELAARAAGGLDDRFVRYVYRKDPAPHLPSTGNGEMGHFGAEYRYGKQWELAQHPTGQSSLLDLATLPVAALVARSPWRKIKVPGFSLDDHLPENYVVALTPPDRPNEYGDDRFSR